MARRPTGHPFQLGVTLSGLFAAPLLPVALWCDYRQAREFGTCDPGLQAYLSNLIRDIKTAGTGPSVLARQRREFLRCAVGHAAHVVAVDAETGLCKPVRVWNVSRPDVGDLVAPLD